MSESFLVLPKSAEQPGRAPIEVEQPAVFEVVIVIDSDPARGLIEDTIDPLFGVVEGCRGVGHRTIDVRRSRSITAEAP